MTEHLITRPIGPLGRTSGSPRPPPSYYPSRGNQLQCSVPIRSAWIGHPRSPGPSSCSEARGTA